MATPTRKTIPKKTREAVWKKDCGESMTGTCFCCSEALSALGTWHAGHIIAQSNGGPDTAENLRVVCRACNLAMGTENMDAFKARCYPPPIVDPRQQHYESLVMPLDKLNRILGKR
jgi:5-methylcytosine-specific restriction endonuclease McrA